MLDPVHPAYWESFSFLSPLQIFSNPLFFVLRTKVNVNDFLCCVLRERTKMEGRTIDRKYSDCPIPPLMDPSTIASYLPLFSPPHQSRGQYQHHLFSAEGKSQFTLNLALEPTMSLLLASFHVFPIPSIKTPIPTSFFLC
ncbi:hypothetical protein E1A91_A13G143300v1 [Gossypium mustelinum]|uniref:Uncharacterized protein n=1 Tax=Gossypium mustelinum TaxID=34275 RepID=A0A5D2WHZ6_GOSMU|nr:hypothetical protein E1A91_A13G143300v1 [Gossypium mustelinum]